MTSSSNKRRTTALAALATAVLLAGTCAWAGGARDRSNSAGSKAATTSVQAVNSGAPFAKRPNAIGRAYQPGTAEVTVHYVNLTDTHGSPISGATLTCSQGEIKASEVAPGMYEVKSALPKMLLQVEAPGKTTQSIGVDFQQVSGKMAYVGYLPDNRIAIMPEPTPVYENKAGGAASAPNPMQGGDTCASALNIASLPYTDNGTTVGFANDYDAVCPYGGSTAPDVVYKFTPGVNLNVNMTLCNSGYDTKLYVFDNVCSGAPVACNDDDSCTLSFRSALTNVPMVAGHTYYIVVDGYGNYSGAYTLAVSGAPPPPANDTCATATLVAIPSVTAGSTTSAALDVEPTCGTAGVPTAPGVWYKVVGNGNPLIASVCESDVPAGSATYDTKISVYSGTCALPVCVAGNDDNCVASGLHSLVQWNSTAGTTYFILVHGFSLSTGDFNLSVHEPPPPCDITPTGTPENEPDCGIPVDTVDGGCNSTPPVFIVTTCGAHYTGTVAWDGATRDTDWYEIDTTTPTRITQTLTHEFAGGGLMGFAEGSGSGNCADLTGYANPFQLPSACVTTSVSVDVAAPGQYWFFVGPLFDTNHLITCGQNPGSQYNVSFTCTALGACCASDNSCVVRTQAECQALGNTYKGDNVPCVTGSLYEQATPTLTYSSISTTGTPSSARGDEAFQTVALPFPFTFFGTVHNSINICSNGYLTFGPDTTFFWPGSIPSPVLPNDMIAPLWTDLDSAPANEGIWYQQAGVTPNRTFTVQWQSGEFAFGGLYQFEGVLFENGCIEFNYGPQAGTPLWTRAVGIEDPTGAGVGLSSSIANGTAYRLCPTGFEDHACFNDPPVAHAGGPYNAECAGAGYSVQLNGSAQDDGPHTFAWTTDCPGGTFSNPAIANPILTGTFTSCGTTCHVTLTVNDGQFTSTSTALVTLVDTTPPVITATLVPLQPARPHQPGSPCSAPSSGLFRIVCSGTDNCAGNVALTAKLLVKHNDVPNPCDECVVRVDEITAHCGDTVDIRLLELTCRSRPPWTPDPSTCTRPDHMLCVQGETVVLQVSGTDTCGNVGTATYNPATQPAPSCGGAPVCCPAIIGPPVDPRCVAPCFAPPGLLPPGFEPRNRKQ